MKTQKEKNKVLAEYLYPDGCWHTKISKTSDFSDRVACSRCGEPRHWKPNPNFYDLDIPFSVMADLQKKVIEEFSFVRYMQSLLKVLKLNEPLWFSTEITRKLWEATQEQRSDACYELIDNQIPKIKKEQRR